MNHNVVKRLAQIVAVLTVLYGCDTAINQIAQEANFGSTGGLLQVESAFSQASVSPGGTGGLAGDNIQGTDDVELPAEETRSFFTAFQIDPVSEDTAGPKFVVAGDVDQDGLLDLVSAWNQSQPVQLHLQRRDPQGTISFRTITLAGTTPIAIVAGIKLGQINNDGWLDIVVLVKGTGAVGLCPTSPPSEISNLVGEIMVLFSPGDPLLIPDGDRWTEMRLANPFVADRWIHNQFPGNEDKGVAEDTTKPEWDGFTALAVADIDGRPGDDIIVALNPAQCRELGQDPPTNTVDLWVNPGPGLAQTPDAWGAPAPTMNLSRGVPVTLMSNAPQIKDIKLMDVDDDGDLDVITSWTNALSRNITWLRNPLVPHDAGGAGGSAEVVAGTPDGIDFCEGGVNDQGPCPGGDVDCLGIADGVCTGGVCVGGANNGGSCIDNNGCVGITDGVCRPGAWHFIATGWQQRPVAQIDTGADILAIGDVDDDGSQDVVVRSTNGKIVQWLRRPNALVVAPEFPPNDPVPDRFDFPWPVFTLTDFDEQEPVAIALGDLTGDGRLEAVLSAGGGVFWYEQAAGGSVFDPWVPNAIIQDSPAGTMSGAATTSPPSTPPVPGAGVGIQAVDTSTHINTLLIVDLDGDGKNDIVGTLDRRSGSGLSDDRLVWYRNTRSDTAP